MINWFCITNSRDFYFYRITSYNVCYTKLLRVYALAQGTIIADTKNTTTGFIYDGATIENEVDYSLKNEDSIRLSLIKNDAKQAYQVEKKINEFFGKPLAMATDTRTVEVKKPRDISIVKFISDVQSIQLNSEFKRKIIIDINRESIIAGVITSYSIHYTKLYEYQYLNLFYELML